MIFIEYLNFHHHFYDLSILIIVLLVACYIELNRSHFTKIKKTRCLIKN